MAQNPYGMNPFAATGSLPDIAEKYRQGVSNVIDWGYGFKDKVRKDFLSDVMMPALMEQAQRDFMQANIGNHVLQAGYKDFVDYGLNTIGKNRISSGTGVLEEMDRRKLHEDTRDQKMQIGRDNVTVGASESGSKVLKADAERTWGDLSSRHADAPSNLERVRRIHNDVMNDPVLRANPQLVERVMRERQKEESALQQQGGVYGIPNAVEEGSRHSGSPFMMKRGEDGRMVPSYGGQEGGPIDPNASQDAKAREERAKRLEKEADQYMKLAKEADDEKMKRGYLANAEDRMREASRLRGGGPLPADRMNGAMGVVKGGAPSAQPPSAAPSTAYPPAAPPPSLPQQPARPVAPPRPPTVYGGPMQPAPPAPGSYGYGAPASPYGGLSPLPPAPVQMRPPAFTYFAPYLPYGYGG